VLLYSRPEASIAGLRTFYLQSRKVGPGVALKGKLEYSCKDAYQAPGYDAAKPRAPGERDIRDRPTRLRATFLHDTRSHREQ